MFHVKSILKLAFLGCLVDNKFFLMNSPGGSLPMDSIQEFKVLNNTSAEFGRRGRFNSACGIPSDEGKIVV